MGVNQKMIDFSSIWERLPLVKKKKLLSEAGYSEIYARRAFSELPYPISVDVEHAYQIEREGAV